MKILIIDDEEFICEILSEFLSEYGEVTTLQEGSKAFDLYKEALDNDDPYNLIYLDVMMPDISGLEVLKLIQNNESSLDEKDKTKIIMITSSYDPDNFFEAYRGGCQVFLTKPLRQNIIQEKLSQLGIEKLKK
ncbi:MAG: response regulator [Candidatus Cloacimonadota bacterium]|nr:MAG: response regulator [Candidatus Cloacimonadota bacterium]